MDFVHSKMFLNSSDNVPTMMHHTSMSNQQKWTEQFIHINLNATFCKILFLFS